MSSAVLCGIFFAASSKVRPRHSLAHLRTAGFSQGMRLVLSGEAMRHSYPACEVTDFLSVQVYQRGARRTAPVFLRATGDLIRQDFATLVRPAVLEEGQQANLSSHLISAATMTPLFQSDRGSHCPAPPRLGRGIGREGWCNEKGGSRGHQCRSQLARRDDLIDGRTLGEAINQTIRGSFSA